MPFQPVGLTGRRRWFFVFLTATIMTGTILSRLAYGNYYFLVDVSIFMYRNFNALVVGADQCVCPRYTAHENVLSVTSFSARADRRAPPACKTYGLEAPARPD